MLSKSESYLTKEMDLKKFIVRQRTATTSLIAMLTGKQSYFVDKMSELTIRESSNFEETSSDSELSDHYKDTMDYAR